MSRVGQEETGYNGKVESTDATSKGTVAIILLSAMLMILVFALTENIVAVSLGSIVNEFGSHDLTWVISSYLLTLTAFQPLYGKFSDLFGRQRSIQWGLIIFLVGSIGCGASPNLSILILFRCLAGIGAGGLAVLPFILISDYVKIEKRSRYMGVVQATYGISAVLGPGLGGILVDFISWRWVFYSSIPTCLIALILTLFFPNKTIFSLGSPKEKLSQVDFWGASSILIGTALLILGLNWGGKQYSWVSLPVIFSLCFGVLFLFIFLFIEWKVASEPVIAAHVLNKSVVISALVGLCIGFSVSTLLNYLPLYHRMVHNRSYTESGLLAMPLMLFQASIAGISGWVVADRPQLYVPAMRLGMLLVVIGNGLWFFIRENISIYEEVFFILLTGSGIGLNIQMMVIVAQSSVPHQDMATVTALVQYSHSIGQVFGVAIHGSIFDNIHTNLITRFQILFLSLVPISLLGLISTFFLPRFKRSTINS